MVHPSPVRNLEHVETAFFIIRREEDPQIPVAQAVVLLRGLKAAVEVFSKAFDGGLSEGGAFTGCIDSYT
jgi:hypothetical protein